MAVSSKSQCFSAIIHLKEKDFRERNSGNIGAEKEISCCKFLSVLEGWHQRTAERLPRDFQAFEENSLEQRVLYELSGDACGSCGYLFRGPCGYNTAAVRSAARTHIYNIVGIADNI